MDHHQSLTLDVKNKEKLKLINLMNKNVYDKQRRLMDMIPSDDDDDDPCSLNFLLASKHLTNNSFKKLYLEPYMIY